ncbi:MAG: IS110 family transposase, partial [Methyloligellaceae bacterium]
MEVAVLGIDLGKTVCSVAGLDRNGKVVLRKRIQRFRLLDFLADLSPCTVAMEACGGAHHIGRFCLRHGHQPRLLSPLYVRPYVTVHKNDDR